MKSKTCRSRFVLLISLIYALSSATPTRLSALEISSKSRSSTNTQQDTDPGRNDQQTRPRPQPQDRHDALSSGRAPLRPRQTRPHGEHLQGGIPQPNPDPRPAQPNPDPRPTHPGEPVVGNPGTPGPGPSRPPNQGRPPGRPSQRPPRNYYPPFTPRPGYLWRGRYNWRLHQHFLGDSAPINPVHRHHFYVGGYFPFEYLPDTEPIPLDLMSYLPPIPTGYAARYYGGYCIVYDPYTLKIVNLMDLYNY